MLLELARREKAAGIIPDEDLDIFIKVHASIITFFFFFLSLPDNIKALELIPSLCYYEFFL